MPAGGGGCYEENIPFPNGWCEGLAARLRGDEMAARAAFTTARKELEEMVRGQPDYAAAICALGVVDAALGNKDAAIREGERAVELVSVNKSAIQGPMLIQYLAVIYAWGGEKDRAIERLTKIVNLPGAMSAMAICVQPALGSPAGDSRFETIVASLAPKR
jgi:tetratricopeptide (TPR) repeat protein